MRDGSFVNLNYFLILENNFNNTFSSITNNESNNIKKTNNNNKNNNNNSSFRFIETNNINNNSNHNENNNNFENTQARITKKIIKRKSDIIAVNGGIINTENNDKIKNINVKIKLNNTLTNSSNNNKLNNLKHINCNANNNTNYKNKNIINKLEKKELQNCNDKEALNIIDNSIQSDYEYSNNMNNKNNDLNGINNNKNNNKIYKKEKKSNKYLNDLNINSAIYNSASPKKKSFPQNISINKIDLSQLYPANSFGQGGGASLILNTSDCNSVSTNKNDKLNLTTNTNEINNKEIQYKILSNNNCFKDSNNIFSKDYISKLDSKEYEYDTFCQAIIETGLSENKMALSKYSENFPAPCGHEICSKLPALEPNVLNFYQNLKKSNIIDIKQDATSHLIFPLGIKLCINQNYHNEELNNEPLINTIYNIKGDIYYIASLTYYRKITIKNYNNIFNINPIDVYNKFKKEEKEKNMIKYSNNHINPNENYINNNKDEYNKNLNKNNLLNKNQNNISKNDSNKKSNIITNKEEDKTNDIRKENDEILQFDQNDIIYIPECLSLISRFPFFNQLSKCLKTIINMRLQLVNGDNNHQITNNISLFIHHLINQIPVGNNKLNISFYTPINIEPITLYNPFSYDFGNFTCKNIFSILNIENIITLFLLVLLEQKIIFVDKNHLILSSITFFFLNIIYPLSWVNTYQPLLSLSTIRYIQSITPFIMGGNESLILYAYYKKYIIYNESFENIDKSNIVFVSLTNNLISCDCYNLINNKKGQSRKHILKYLGIPDLPKNIEKKLYNHLSDIEKIDNLKVMNEKLKTFFCRIMVFILDDYKDHYLYSLDKPIFNKENYLMCKKEDKKLFYKELLGTQLFTQFIFIENELYKNKKLCGKKLKKKNMTYGIAHDGIYKDDSFFMKNKNKIEELKIMLKRRRKERIRKPLISAKKLVKNIGQIIYGTSENKRKGNSKVNSSKKITKINISVIKHKKERNKIDNILLMPYFIEEPDIELNDIEKYDYIQNKLNSIITLDNQLNQTNNYKNKYIFEFNQKFNLKLIKDDYTRYFIGTLNENINNNDSNILNISSNEMNSKFNGKKSARNSSKKNKLINNKILNDEQENKYLESKEKIYTWFTNIYLSSSKKKIFNNIDINKEIRNERNRKVFSKLITQNYKTLFDIRENNQNFLNNESFMELLLKIKIILNFMTYNEFETCKLITLSCFKYYTILEEHKHTRFYLYNKYNDLYSPCNLWLDNIFWKTWFDDDISYIEKRMNMSDENDYSFDLDNLNEEDNELYKYNEENNNFSIEYKLLIKIHKVMSSLKLGDEFIKKVIFDDLACNYLTEDEINLFKDQYE